VTPVELDRLARLAGIPTTTEETPMPDPGRDPAPPEEPRALSGSVRPPAPPTHPIYQPDPVRPPTAD